MVPTDYLLNTYGLKSAEEYWAQKPEVQYQQRLNIMKNVDYPGNLHNTTGLKPAEADYGTEKLSSSDKYNPNNYYHTGYFSSLNWDDWTCKYAQIAGDCVDLNTINDTLYVYPEGSDFSVTKMALATEELWKFYQTKA